MTLTLPSLVSRAAAGAASGAPLDEARGVVERLMTAIAAGDIAATQALLRDDTESHSDGGGQYAAARNIVVGSERVATLIVNLARKLNADVGRVEFGVFAGLPGVYFEREGRSGNAPRNVVLFDVDEQLRVRAVYSILADDKLAGVRV